MPSHAPHSDPKDSDPSPGESPDAPLPSIGSAGSVIPCEEAQTLVRRFASGGVSARSLATEEHRALRAHCEACPGCSDHFAGVVGTLARLGHERRLTRIASEKDRRRRSLRSDVFEAQKPQSLIRGRLRALVYPALITFLLVALGQRVLNPLGAQVQAQGPEVWLRGQVLRPDHGIAQLRAGERLAVGEDGAATVQLGETQWTLTPHTEMRLEEFRPPSLRLFRGELQVTGPFVCFTPDGIVKAPEAAQAHIWWSEIGLEVSVDDGEVQVVSAEGTLTLRAGQAYPAID